MKKCKLQRFSRRTFSLPPPPPPPFVTFSNGKVHPPILPSSIPPPQRKLEVNPLPPSDVLNIYTYYYQKQFFLPSPSRRQKFPPWGCGYFLEQPLLFVLSVPYFAILHCLMPNDLTPNGRMLAIKELISY
jgi:hypothetical protein